MLIMMMVFIPAATVGAAGCLLQQRRWRAAELENFLHSTPSPPPLALSLAPDLLIDLFNPARWGDSCRRAPRFSKLEARVWGSSFVGQ